MGIIVPGDIKTKNNLNPGIQGFADGKFDTSKVFAFNRQGNNKINPFPKNIERYMLMDSSLFQFPTTQYGYNTDDFIDSLPQIRIKEYLPELPMDQWLNVFGETFKQMETVFKAVKDQKDQKLSEIMSKLTSHIMDGSIIQSLMDQLMSKIGMTVPSNHSLEYLQMYTFPEIIYRRLLSYQTTNWYILPYSGKIDFGSKGQAGWQQRSLSDRFQMVTNLFKNVNINTRPMWRLQNQDGDTIDMELVLFNDTIKSAVNNFRFIHTIIPNNMWTQYGIMQHNSSLYDVQFSGGMRYFCCSLDVSCEQIGKSRMPPAEFLDAVVTSDGYNEEKLLGFEHELEYLEEQFGEGFRRIEELEKQLADKKNELKSAKKDKDDAEAILVDIPNDTMALEKKTNAEREIKSLTSEIEDLNDEIQNQKENIDNFQQNSKRFKELKKLSFDISETIGNIQDLKSDPLFLESFRIPDMYKLTLRFKSLIPTNFNTYMMTFWEDAMLNHTFEKKEDKGHYETVYTNFGTTLASTIKKEISP